MELNSCWPLFEFFQVLDVRSPFGFFRDIFVGDFGLASWLILTPSDSAVVTPPTASCCCWITEADCADGCDEDGDT